jgi:hypothetical protein
MDASTGNDINDASDIGSPPTDVPLDAGAPDADASIPRDADAATVDATDGGPTGTQILPMHGSPIESPTLRGTVQQPMRDR